MMKRIVLFVAVVAFSVAAYGAQGSKEKVFRLGMIGLDTSHVMPQPMTPMGRR